MSTARPAERPRMTVEQYLAWAQTQPDAHYELVDGVPCKMSPERTSHAWVKGAICRVFEGAIGKSGLSLLVFPEGPTIVTGQSRAREPDVVVHSAEGIDWDAMILERPIILVEVTSPSTVKIDTGTKVGEYFSIDSVLHYLVVDPSRREVVHYRRSDSSRVEMHSLKEGLLRLDPPGVEVPLEHFFAGLPMQGRA